MQFQLLGALKVEDGGREIVVAGTKLRLLLATLLLHANEVVPRDLLIDAVWGPTPPQGAGHRLDMLVSRLRQRVGRRLRTTEGGYALRVEEGELDVQRFEQLLREGREAAASGSVERAVELLRVALEEWHGPALGELAYERFAALDGERLEELRLDALEELLEAELRCGRHAEAVPDLEVLVESRPLRERPRAQLMLALYRSGRQAEALDVYRAGRELLATELGLEPGQELQRLQVQILQHDPRITARS